MTGKLKFITIAMVLVLALVFSTAALAAQPAAVMDEYQEVWDGKRGMDSWYCTIESDDDPRNEFIETGWIHWVFNTKGKSTDAYLVLGGTGSGTYYPGEPLNAKVWHFYTPYFELDGLTATIHLNGKPGPGSGLVISDWCPGEYESLAVSKVAFTSYTRTHFWDIEKSVTTENGYLLDGYPKIWLYIDGHGNETATWTVDAIYDGYQDSNFNVSGVITITNDGQLPAVITAVDDVLAGTLIEVACGVEFPYELSVGYTLTCSYSEAGYIEGINEVTVTTERDVYSASAEIIWGDPTTEINKTVTIVDLSDLFGEVVLGTATAPNGATFTYSKDFAWADYGKDACGKYAYENTATILETGQFASALLKVNVQCYKYDTAYAKGDPAQAFCNDPINSTRWGWTNPIYYDNTYVWDLWAGAGKCDTSNGTLVGTVTVVFDTAGYVTVTYNVGFPYDLQETHVYAGYDMVPPDGVAAPGQYENYSPFAPGSMVYVIAHAVVGTPDPDFGP